MVSRCSFEEVAPLMSNVTLLETFLITVLVTCGFAVSKSTFDTVRRRLSRVTVVVVGAGPVGLLSVLIAAKTGKVAKLILYEEKSRGDLMNRSHHIALEDRTVKFLKSLGVDFDNIEGCWQNTRFFTRIGVLQEYLLSMLDRIAGVEVETKLNSKFSRESLKELDCIPGRLLAIVCDGSHGRSASLLGLGDEFAQHSCKAYGAVAAIERQRACSVPTPELRVHNLTFDLGAYDNGCKTDPYPVGFHFKIFGGDSHRYLALAVPKCESGLVKTLKMVLDQAIMRNIFQACYNSYKWSGDASMSDTEALKNMKFSPRLFEIKLAERMENVVYIEDANLFAVTEGEAARFLNFRSGVDVNLSIQGLQSLGKFIQLAACADTDKAILRALNYKHSHARAVTHDFTKYGIKKSMYSA